MIATRARWRSQEGSALVMVMGTMTVLTLLVSVAFTYAMQTTSTVRYTRDWTQALAAAEAGVDDYLARLNANDTYWLNTPDCANPAMRRPFTGSSPPCGWGASTKTGWAVVPGSPRAYFHYRADTTSTAVNGTIALDVTGSVGKVRRSISVVLRRGGFGEFLYYTVYETIDPANEAIYGLNNTTAMDKCSHYYWEPASATSKPRDTSYCSDINFVTGDKINGPLHSNDSLLMNGTPWFQGTVSTSWPQCRPASGGTTVASKCFRAANGSTNPRFDKGVAYRSEIDLPDSIGNMRQYVDPAQTTKPGCLYTGPTRIKFNTTASGATPTMTVWSKWSKTLIPACGDPTRAWPQTVVVPHNNLIMIQDVPATQSTPASGACATGAIGDGYPQANDYNQTLREADCRYGTVYIEGTLTGRVTVSADNNIIITDDLTYASGKNGIDVLGLIATNSVKVYHPVARECTKYDSRGRCTTYGPYENMRDPGAVYNSNPVVHAAILTLQHSFTVQSYQHGDPLGSINLFGSFAQRYRGPVGTNSGGTISSGYLKNYEYDTRLRYAPPPYFLDPVRSSWGMKTFGETTVKTLP